MLIIQYTNYKLLHSFDLIGRIRALFLAVTDSASIVSLLLALHLFPATGMAVLTFPIFPTRKTWLWTFIHTVPKSTCIEML